MTCTQVRTQQVPGSPEQAPEANQLTRWSRRAVAVTKLPKPIPRDSIRLGLPSKGRMAEDTMQLLKVTPPQAANQQQQFVPQVASCCLARLAGRPACRTQRPPATA